MTSTMKDYLRIDPDVPNQNYFCISIVGPEFRQKSSKIKVMVRGGAFRELSDAAEYAKNANQCVDIYNAQLGYWCSFLPESRKDKDANVELNHVMHEYLRERVRQDLAYKRNTKDRVEIAKDEGKNPEKLSGGKMTDDTTSKNNADSKPITNTFETNDVAEEDSGEQERWVGSKEVKFDSEVPLPKNKYACVSFVSPQPDSIHQAYGFKVRAIFATMEECQDHIKTLEEFEKKIVIHIVNVGEWLIWDPDSSMLDNQQFSDPTLNNIIQEHQSQTNKVKQFKQKMEEEKMEKEFEDELEDDKDPDDDVIKVEEIDNA